MEKNLEDHHQSSIVNRDLNTSNLHNKSGGGVQDVTPRVKGCCLNRVQKIIILDALKREGRTSRRRAPALVVVLLQGQCQRAKVCAKETKKGVVIKLAVEGVC